MEVYKFVDKNLNTINDNKQPIEVKLTRVQSSARNVADLNNNKTRQCNHPTNLSCTNSNNYEFPVACFSFAILMVTLFTFRKYINVTKEDDISVSWKSIFLKGEYWRVFYAHYFHFGKIHLYFNVIFFMAVGGLLEKKLKKSAILLLVPTMAMLSNIFYILLTDFFCSTHPGNESTFGFNMVILSMRMIHTLTLERNSNSGKGEPTLIFGFLPLYLPMMVAPWCPILEAIFVDVIVLGRCIAANISGILAGLLFPYLMKHYRNHIMLPRYAIPLPPENLPRQAIPETDSRSSTSSIGSSSNSDNENNNYD